MVGQAFFLDALKARKGETMVQASTLQELYVIVIGVFLALTSSPVVLAESDDQLFVGAFSKTQPGKTFPPGWEPLIFEKIHAHTQYDLVKDGDRVVVKAVSQHASSGLTKEITIDPKEYPVVQWRWKIINVLKNGNVYEKSGDDYPARLYITFEYDSSQVGFFEKAKYETAKFLYGQYPPIGAINYIWDGKSPIGTMVPNTYTDRVIMIVIESGETRINEWITEERNVFEDYKKAFGEDPPNISGVAIMTDTDNTKESAVSYFGDIVFKKKEKARSEK